MSDGGVRKDEDKEREHRREEIKDGFGQMKTDKQRKDYGRGMVIFFVICYNKLKCL